MFFFSDYYTKVSKKRIELKIWYLEIFFKDIVDRKF